MMAIRTAIGRDVVVLAAALVGQVVVAVIGQGKTETGDSLIDFVGPILLGTGQLKFHAVLGEDAEPRPPLGQRPDVLSSQGGIQKDADGQGQHDDDGEQNES